MTCQISFKNQCHAIEEFLLCHKPKKKLIRHTLTNVKKLKQN
jgi:hypothetical protein